MQCIFKKKIPGVVFSFSKKYLVDIFLDVRIWVFKFLENLAIPNNCKNWRTKTKSSTLFDLG